jgi:hypothetical protein
LSQIATFGWIWKTDTYQLLFQFFDGLYFFLKSFTVGLNRNGHAIILNIWKSCALKFIYIYNNILHQISSKSFHNIVHYIYSLYNAIIKIYEKFKCQDFCPANIMRSLTCNIVSQIFIPFIMYNRISTGHLFTHISGRDLAI